MREVYGISHNPGNGWKRQLHRQLSRIQENKAALLSVEDRGRMGNQGDLEKYSAAFAEFMTPDEEGEPLLLVADLKHALISAEIPTSFIPKLVPLMDPESSGKISFEKFVSVCESLTAPEHSEESDSFIEEEDDFDNEDVEDDEDEDEDEDYKDDDIDVNADAESEEGSKSASKRRVFDILSQGHDRITVDSLEHVNRLINMNVSKQDLEKMVERASTRTDFLRIWRRLE